MACHYILANLLADTDQAVGALFLDDRGETVELACSELSPYQMQVVGAYLGIYLRQVERLLASNHLGEPRLLHIEKESLHIYLMPLPDGYSLALVQRQPAIVGLAVKSLSRAVSQLKAELF